MPIGRRTIGRYADPDYADAEFYDLENLWGPDDDFFLRLAQRVAGPVLDVGCGTGRLARAMAEAGLAVTGIEPALPMLTRARQLGSDGIADYFPGDARSFLLDRRFRLAVMTAHGFQHLIGPADQVAALANVALHLEPGGIFAFDLRNPAAQNFEQPGRFLRRGGFYDREGRRVEVEAAPRWDPTTGCATYLIRRRIPATGEVRRSRTVLQYTDAETLDERLAEAGLVVTARYGDWPDLKFEPASPEIITICRRAG